MPNFFTDNEDIRDYLHSTDMRQIVTMLERDYKQADEFDYAPSNYEDAIDNYHRVLTVLGDIAGNFIAPRAEDVDREGAQFEDGKVTYAKGTQEALEQLSKAELMGLTLPRCYGGLNMPVLVLSIAIEIVSRADGSLMNIFGLQDIAETINKFADEDIKTKYLPQLASGQETAAMALTEPDAGSDLGNVQLRAWYDEEAQTWRLRGVKRFITNGCAGVSLVLARTEEDVEGARGLSMLLAEDGPQVQIRRIEDKLGIHGSPTCEIQYNDAPALLIGKRKRGLSTYVMSMMNGARLAIAGQGVGIAQAALEEALEYAAEREQFGKPIRQFPAVRQLLGDMHMMVETSRLLTYDTAFAVDMAQNIEHLADSGELESLPGGEYLRKDKRKWATLARALTPMAKYYATECCNRVCYDSLQVLGGSGFMRDYAVERLFRDARITTIYEGTTQIQQAAAVGGVLKGVLEDYFAELHDELQGNMAVAGMLKKLADARATLRSMVDFANEQDQAFKDLHAGRIVETATTILCGYLLLKPATRSDHKEALAEHYFNEVMPRVDMWYGQVMSGGRTYLDRMPELLDYA